jgi:serine/threonine protein kinase
VEKYYETRLDDRVEVLSSETECLRLALKLAYAIHELHDNDLVHGCLSPSHVFIEEGQVVLNGLGLHSLKKYLSLITGYTNKTLYTAVEYLRDKNSVVIKPSKPADIYSFGIILYEMVTMNRQYRQLPFRDVQIKFSEENFRPKLPDRIKH